ncbi:MULTISPECIES: fatty acid cis/trans isomerase [Cycloclasticus]|jgi:hypothetical protein|uniref:Fatty acid cis-trans isomerase n=1 Tax=Cycloclasticus zancles 78-ME TaxID=1198232 RepID=S5TXV7_9GAMM|nr:MULTISPECIES: fatty acid cis/trans isomerase [Cycloclasticus]AGS40015.1 Fatty acid cis-trans isomerase [Cycloclasticus zancles 78-ME]MBV1899552.1 fatty acid cis/trans isomerase [Cycloclasticus sp.]MDF1830279.1 fatty acid cis/trans isomerase [Cycloclasticus pugetii]SHJ30569.1 Fatty acid cis/trans isomerase (CTI) [Cycloclasticus pugetii]
MHTNTIRNKNLNFMVFFSLVLVLAACEKDNRTAPRVIGKHQTFDYHSDIKPILEKKCIACHACYDAPCQLKMQSPDGLERGATKQSVYDATRLNDASPTRLSIDAQSAKEWREKGFFSVLEKRLQHGGENNNQSLFKNMIDLALQNPLTPNQPIPKNIQLGLKRENTCPAPGEFSDYAKNNPHGGMPLAVAGLNESEAQTLSTWLSEGAKIVTKNIDISPEHQAMIVQWETWLNSNDKRTALVARYLYEHLFLGHLYFDQVNQSAGNSPNAGIQFYSLVRSYTPSGQKIMPVNTARPFDDVNQAFYYRLKAIEETIVHKTHIPYRFDQQRLKHFKQLFMTPGWSVDKLPGYSYLERSNPFITYQAIPAKARYRFLLDNAEFFIRNFIRGPVCRGQIATNVIRDQFWVMFENPKHEVYTNNPDYQHAMNPYLGLPGEKTSLLDFGSQWMKYETKRNQYIGQRQLTYQKTFPQGATKEHIWNGEQVNDNAFLTVFRHHDNASVTKGWKGELPLTTWLMDYPLLERTYYELVVSFNVFGSASHQTQTRLYFDLIRNSSEVNFLRLMPADYREPLYKKWYPTFANIKTEFTYHDIDIDSPVAINYETKEPYSELLTSQLNDYPALSKAKDSINRCDAECHEAASLKKETFEHQGTQINQLLSKLASTPASQLKAINWLPEISFIKIEQLDGQFLSYSMLKNRRHSSVSFILGESLRHQDQQDTLAIFPELIGSYPNLMFVISIKELNDFVFALSQADTPEAFDAVINKWGIRRMNPNFWNVLHDFTTSLNTKRPLESGIYDINRYGRW